MAERIYHKGPRTNSELDPLAEKRLRQLNQPTGQVDDDGLRSVQHARSGSRTGSRTISTGATQKQYHGNVSN